MSSSKHFVALVCVAAVVVSLSGVVQAKTYPDGSRSQHQSGFGHSRGHPGLEREHDDRVFTVQTNADLAFTALPGASAYWGVYDGIQGPASYTAEFPDNWNGRLIMYTHGFRGEGSVVTREVPNAAFRNTAMALGFAWAASSYSANFYDVRAAIEDTNKLALNLTGYLARDWSVGYDLPAQYLIAGVSMGGHAAAAAVERETIRTARYPVRYAGALPMCQAEQNEFQWLGDYNRVARELAGFGRRPYEDYQEYVDQVVSNLFESDENGSTYVPKNKAGELLKAIAMNLTGGKRPIFEEGFRNPTWQGAVLGTGGSDGTVTGILAREIYDNTHRIYRWTDGRRPNVWEWVFKAKVGRLKADRGVNPVRDDGVRWLPLVQGDFNVPVLTMHTLGDFFVPFVHQQRYRKAANRNGNGDLLVQRAIRDANHCGFSGAEFSTALVDLITWVDTGIKPGGDEVLDTDVVADDQYGCAYTDNTLSFGRESLPQCE